MEWKEVTLGDLCEISSSKRIFAKEYQTNGIPFYRGKEIIEKQKGNTISNELFISRNRFEEIKAKYGVPQQRELLLTSVGTLGVPYVIKEEEFYFKDGNLTWFRHFNELDVEYLYYWFLSPYGKNEINAKAIGSTQKALTIDSLSKFNIKIPVKLEDQRRIASILSSLDRKIELNNKINADLEEMAQAIFKNWFVDFEPFKDGKFVDSELGMIPEGWKVGRLDEIADVVGGSTPSKAKPEYYTQKGIAWLTPKDLSNHPAVYTSRGEIDITEEGYNSTSTKLMPKGTVLFTSRAPIGYISIAQNDICTNQGFKSLVPKKAGTCFLYCFLKYVTPEIENKSTGSTFKEASGSLMKSLQVIMPEQKVFEDFETIVSPLFARIESLEKENSRLSTLRDTLLPRLMSGELEVPE
mgnify:CR=1 FL=1